MPAIKELRWNGPKRECAKRTTFCPRCVAALDRILPFESIAGDVPEAERYSYVYSGAQMRYDYILPDADTASRRTAVTIVHGADVSAASDHSPIVATFGWR